MRLIIVTALLLLSTIKIQAQSIVTNQLTNLETTISECSGLIIIGGKLITHNDSGNDACLYEIDSITGNVLRTVNVANAVNHDWEDIAKDNQYIYIGDIGNNEGDRTDLKIYRISISDYLNTVNNIVYADSICFSYLDQTSFTPSPYTTNYDAEAFIATNNSLFVMTKNWLNQKSNLYRVPKLPGTFQLQLIDSLDTQGLISGATYNPDNNTIMLCGYSATNNFIVKISQFDQNNIFDCNYEILNLQTQAIMQIEAICPKDTDEYYLSSESSQNGDAMLFRINVDILTSIPETTKSETLIFPTPANDFINIKTSLPTITRIYDIKGQELIESANKKINIQQLPTGTYHIVLSTKTAILLNSKLIVVKP